MGRIHQVKKGVHSRQMESMCEGVEMGKSAEWSEITEKGLGEQEEGHGIRWHGGSVFFKSSGSFQGSCSNPTTDHGLLWCSAAFSLPYILLEAALGE